jgi:hypothetical protein
MISSLDFNPEQKHRYINIMEKCFKRNDKIGLAEGKGGQCPVNAEVFP